MSDATAQGEPSAHAGRNKEFFDKMAKNYDSEDWTKRLTAKFTKELQDNADWMGVEWAKPGEDRQVRMLDFACGPGSASQAFLSRVTQVRGLDISTGMVEEYNRRAAEQGRTAEQMQATAADLLADDPSSERAIAGPDYHGFDFAIVTWALHHMEKPQLALGRMVERLKPGGVVVVLDWTEDPATSAGPLSHGAHSHGGGGGGHGHGHGHEASHGHGHAGGQAKDILFGEQGKDDPSRGTVAHYGFSRDRIESLLREAGCDDTGHLICKEAFSFGGAMAGVEKRAFIARGSKKRRPD